MVFFFCIVIRKDEEKYEYRTTLGEIDISATTNKINVLFQIFRWWTFLYCSQYSYHSSNVAVAKVVTLNLCAIFLVSLPYLISMGFLFSFLSSYHSS